MTSVKNVHLLSAACALVLPLLACPKSTPATSVSTIPVGDSRCANGGIEVTTGKSVKDICNQSPQLTETQLPVGDAHCPNGGVELQTGYADSDGGVDVTSTQYVCTNDGVDVGSFAPPDGPAGAFKINASGGNSSGGPGGSGGEFAAGLEAGSNGGHLKLFATGAASATVVLPSPMPTPILGSVAWQPTASAEVTFQMNTTPSGLASGDAFTTGDGNLYVWNGSSADIATGVSIPSGVTVTFDPGSGNSGVEISVDDDFVNAGTLTTGTLSSDGVSRASLGISASMFEGLAGSSIDLSGKAGTGGGNGGNGGTLSIACNMSRIINGGAVNLSGGTGAVGGAGAFAEISSYSGITNTGDFTCSAGTSQTGAGAPGGGVVMEVQVGAIENSGNVDAAGSAGNPSAGPGGHVAIEIAIAGAIVNTGKFSLNGGSASAACTSGCNGAPGGTVTMVAAGADLTTTGDLIVNGGEGGAGAGGAGGEMELVTGPPSGSSTGSNGGTIRISGNLDVHGGGGATDGAPAGQIEVISEAAAKGPSGQEVIFLGYGQGVQLNGGTGTVGAHGGQVELINSIGVVTSGIPVVGGSIINTCDIGLGGGSGSAGAGGPGGSMMAQTQVSVFFPDPVEMMINTGNITATGGAGTTAGGPNGVVQIETRNGFINTGNWTLDGGAATAASGVGGSGSMMLVEVTQGPISNTGNFSMSGGPATASGGTGGSAATIAIAGSTVTNAGNFTLNGGNGAAVGGNGGVLEYLSTAGSTTNTGTVSVKGGTGATAGGDGSFVF